MEKKIKKKIKIKILPTLIVFALIGFIIGCYYLLTLIPIKNIYITGNQYLTDQEIIELAGIENYPSFLKTKIFHMKKNINKNDYISSVSIQKKFFAEIHIEIKEHNLLFRKDDTGNIVLDNQKEINDQNRYQLPILLNYIPDTKYDSFINKMNQVEDDIKYQISEIRYYPNEQDEDRFLLYMNDGNYVYLTLTKFKQINYYKEVLEKIEDKKGILYLDSGNHFQIMEE